MNEETKTGNQFLLIISNYSALDITLFIEMVRQVEGALDRVLLVHG